MRNKSRDGSGNVGKYKYYHKSPRIVVVDGLLSSLPLSSQASLQQALPIAYLHFLQGLILCCGIARGEPTLHKPRVISWRGHLCLFLLRGNSRFLAPLSFSPTTRPFLLNKRKMVDSMDRHSDKIEEATVEAVSPAASYPDHDDEFTPEEQKQIIRRIDRRLVVTLGVLYCVSLMDRTNLGAAVIAGMGTELRLVGDRYVRAPPSMPSSS